MTALAQALRDLLLPIATAISTGVRALTGDPNPTVEPAAAERAARTEEPQP